jgi:hypothetical protein
MASTIARAVSVLIHAANPSGNNYQDLRDTL